MARKPEVLAVAPVLPPKSIDFNAMHDAIERGANADEAVRAALGRAPEPVVVAPDDEA